MARRGELHLMTSSMVKGGKKKSRLITNKKEIPCTVDSRNSVTPSW